MHSTNKLIRQSSNRIQRGRIGTDFVVGLLIFLAACLQAKKAETRKETKESCLSFTRVTMFI